MRIYNNVIIYYDNEKLEYNPCDLYSAMELHRIVHSKDIKRIECTCTKTNKRIEFYRKYGGIVCNIVKDNHARNLLQIY